jgi:hypothetical protein
VGRHREYHQARLDLHLRQREAIDRLHQIQIICKGLDNQGMVDLWGIDITGSPLA